MDTYDPQRTGARVADAANRALCVALDETRSKLNTASAELSNVIWEHTADIIVAPTNRMAQLGEIENLIDRALRLLVEVRDAHLPYTLVAEGELSRR